MEKIHFFEEGMITLLSEDEVSEGGGICGLSVDENKESDEKKEGT